MVILDTQSNDCMWAHLILGPDYPLHSPLEVLGAFPSYQGHVGPRSVAQPSYIYNNIASRAACNSCTYGSSDLYDIGDTSSIAHIGIGGASMNLLQSSSSILGGLMLRLTWRSND